MKRGFTYAEAVQYAGVKRRTFDAHWRPRLNAMQHGTCVIFDRLELDLLFEQFKAQATGVVPARQADDASTLSQQNGVRNERPIMKGVSPWAEKLPASTPVKKEPGKLTSGGEVRDFASVASALMRRRRAG